MLSSPFDKGESKAQEAEGKLALDPMAQKRQSGSTQLDSFTLKLVFSTIMIS